MERFILVDCNNFFVSCERVFDPKLRKKPVVVLSSNDACIIARSNEAKALGIPMGAPAFEYADLFFKHKVIVYSSNFALYGDMSNRVMETLTRFASNIEIYSIDEAFLFVSRYDRSFANVPDEKYYLQYGIFLQEKVKRDTGIPVSIGIGATKTLAKIANRLAKKNPHYKGVFDITNHPDMDTLLESIEVGDVWGIGYRYARLLQSKNIYTARQFKYMNEKWVKAHMTITGLKTLLELRGVSCMPLEECPEPKKSIVVSRLFGKKTTQLHHAKEAVASYVSSAAQKLRMQHSLAYHITVFTLASRYHDPYGSFNSASAVLPIATAYTPHLITAAHGCLEKIFKQGLVYKKVGVLLTGLVPETSMQLSFISDASLTTDKQDTFIKTVDFINSRWGRDTLFFAATGIERPWRMHQAKKSPCFTTNWHELLTITTRLSD